MHRADSQNLLRYQHDNDDINSEIEISTHCENSAALAITSLRNFESPPCMCRSALACHITVKTLLTHTFQWTVQAMGFQRLWVGGGEKKISTQESRPKFRENHIFFFKIGLLDQKPNIQYHLGKSLLMDFSSMVLASWLSKDWSGFQVDSREFGDE